MVDGGISAEVWVWGGGGWGGGLVYPVLMGLMFLVEQAVSVLQWLWLSAMTSSTSVQSSSVSYRGWWRGRGECLLL